jgi:hypothetical protein
MSDLNFSLLPWQQEVFADKTRFKVIAAGRRCGKSRLSAVTLLIEGLQCTAGSAVLYVAPTNGQARQIIWDVLMELGREVIQSSHINNMDITLDPSEIESAKKTLSSFAFKQEYMASFDNAGSDVFKEEWIKYGEEPEYGSYFVAVDLAGFEEVARQAANSKKRLDQTAIAVVKVTDEGKWFVKEIAYGRWDIRETAATILLKMREYRPLSVGIERGALKNAVLPYLSDLMRKNNVYSHIVDLTHGNRKKTDRIIWSLQGRFEHGRIVLNSEEDWDEFKDQLLMFPANGVHDDLPDALSYIDQLAVTSYFVDDQEDEWEPLDIISGI